MNGKATKVKLVALPFLLSKVCVYERRLFYDICFDLNEQLKNYFYYREEVLDCIEIYFRDRSHKISGYLYRKR